MGSHEEQVDRQFSAVANAYLTSVVHAQGQDLLRTAEIFRGRGHDRVLDVGCGAGHMTFAIAPHVGAVTAFDLSRSMLDVVMESARVRGLSNITLHQGIAEDLPFANESFDWVCTRYSAHHWERLPRALDEMRRVLKPGGGLIVIDILGPDTPLIDTHMQAIELLRDASHVRDYTLSEWKTYLSSAGFHVSAHHRWKMRLEFESWVNRIRTPADRVSAIRAVLKQAPEQVREYLMVEDDGSFQFDAGMIEAGLASEYQRRAPESTSTP
ncbi:MAG: methyltransferase domain-containing protein [Burkholderiaceae bacterium]|nr:methyltransferase domain-containing protein [Burkholderiaceae bacterium]